MVGIGNHSQGCGYARRNRATDEGTASVSVRYPDDAGSLRQHILPLLRAVCLFLQKVKAGNFCFWMSFKHVLVYAASDVSETIDCSVDGRSGWYQYDWKKSQIHRVPVETHCHCSARSFTGSCSENLSLLRDGVQLFTVSDLEKAAIAVVPAKVLPPSVANNEEVTSRKAGMCADPF